MSATKRGTRKTSTRRSTRRGKKVQTLQFPPVQTLHPPEQAIRRLVLNQPSSRYGIKPGWFRDTVSCAEHESIRAHFVLWTRGRVYFEQLGDSMPRCKSTDGAQPASEVTEPISPACGEWDDNGLFVPRCPLAMWHTGDGERRSPVCRETWSLLGIDTDDDLPFWISLKGTSLRPTRQFLSMCYARIRMQGVQLFQCAITLTSTLVENRHGQFYIVQFRKPEWIGPDDAAYNAVAETAAVLVDERVERTFDFESQQAAGPGPASASA